jgi:hypothetical protein
MLSSGVLSEGNEFKEGIYNDSTKGYGAECELESESH